MFIMLKYLELTMRYQIKVSIQRFQAYHQGPPRTERRIKILRTFNSTLHHRTSVITFDKHPHTTFIKTSSGKNIG